MDVTIDYCRACHLEAPAREIAAALERDLGLTANVRPGFWGTFRVECDGEELFNRWKSRGLLGRLGFGRTPRPEEIVDLVRAFQARNPGCSLQPQEG